MARPRNPLAKIRKTIAAWPETDERISHGSPTFWGGKKTFASFHVNHHGDGRVALWLKLPDGLDAGELVVTAGAAFLSDGMKVTLLQTGEQPAEQPE